MVLSFCDCCLWCSKLLMVCFKGEFECFPTHFNSSVFRHPVAIRVVAADRSRPLASEFSHIDSCFVFSQEISWNKSDLELGGIQFLALGRFSRVQHEV